MTVEQLIERAKRGELPPVSVLVGSERFWIERAVQVLRAAVLKDGVAGFNDDLFQGQGLSAATVLSAARTLPMMASRRFVLVRGVEAMATAEQDKLAGYLREPSPEACVVLVFAKLDGRTKLARAARESRCWFDAESPKLGQVSQLAQREARERGHELTAAGAAFLADAVGTDLSALDDAVERLSLFVGSENPIDEEHVAQCVTHARSDSIWSLVDAVGARKADVALGAAASLLAEREPPLRILALIARQFRVLAKMRGALGRGLRPQEAAQAAGAPPFKAQELSRLCRDFDEPSLARAFEVLAATDLALKGSRVAGARVLERALVELCR